MSSTMTSLSALILLLLSVVSLSQAQASTCLSQGFDPSNLSCDTCVLLRNTDFHLTCLECCQSYKTLDSKTSRYQAALLLHAQGSEEVDKFVEEEGAKIQEQKSGLRIEKQQPSSSGMYGMFGMRPSVLYFFKTPDDSDLNAASEQIALRGWSKDDLKDMINTLLPDKQ